MRIATHPLTARLQDIESRCKTLVVVESMQHLRKLKYHVIHLVSEFLNVFFPVDWCVLIYRAFLVINLFVQRDDFETGV